ncbi:MAG: SMC-Scp complex subunit ScpB [Rhodospirillaceae bacterium]
MTEETLETDSPAGELPVNVSADGDNRRRFGRIIEAVLFASATPVLKQDLVGRLPVGADIDAILRDLQADYADRGVNLVQVGNAFAFRTAADVSASLQIDVITPRKLSRAAVETMAIIAYHQPITRAEIEEMRGVSLSRGTLDILLEAGWIRPGRRRQSPGRPSTWITGQAFLDHFALADLADLPGVEEMKAAGLLDRQIGRVSIAIGDSADLEDDEEDEEQLYLSDMLDPDSDTPLPEENL